MNWNRTGRDELRSGDGRYAITASVAEWARSKTWQTFDLETGARLYDGPDLWLAKGAAIQAAETEDVAGIQRPGARIATKPRPRRRPAAPGQH